jgi:transcriptional regulator with XRE-family HTH domain
MTDPAEAKQQNTADAVGHECDMGIRIRQAREEARLSQDDVAEALRITVGAVSQWENRRTLPSRNSLLAFAQLTGADPAWLESGVKVIPSGGKSPSSIMTALQHSWRRVPIITAARAIKTEKARLARLLPVRTKGWVTPYYSCSPQSFALEIFDRHNVPEFQIGEIVVIDTDEAPVAGDMVLAAIDADQIGNRPVFARYMPRPPLMLLQPLGQHEEVEVVGPGHLHGRIVGTMVEHIRTRRSSPMMPGRKLSADSRFSTFSSLVKVLAEIDNAADLQALAKKQHIGLPRDLRRPGADFSALRDAIIKRARKRLRE